MHSANKLLRDGRTEIDNSAAERVLRGVAIGRRNYLFAVSDSGGARAAAIYSLIGTAKLNGVAPEAWLRHVLTHLADHSVNRVGEFLPGATPGRNSPSETLRFPAMRRHQPAPGSRR